MKGGRVKILIIDDDEEDAKIALEYLLKSEYYSFEVSWESDSKRARQQMLQGDFDVFLIDYQLGAVNGLDLIKESQRQGVLKPFILLTGQGDLTIDLDASEFGAADYLDKDGLTPLLLERSIRYAITQSKIIRTLSKKEREYSSLFERSIQPIFLMDHELKIMDLNKSFLTLVGYQVSDFQHHSIKEIFVKESEFSYFQSTLKEFGLIKDFEVMLISKERATIGCLVNCAAIQDEASDFFCYKGVVHDLTNRKKAEREMLEAERLSITGKMARTIAHEVRNPLTNLNLALESLKNELPPGNESIQLYMDIMQRNTIRIEELMGVMLNSSQPGDLKLELVYINHVLEGAIGLCLDRIKLKEINLHRNFATNLPRILVDKEKVQMALLNILLNAIEAITEGNGKLLIATSEKNGIMIVSITDNGKGISPAEMDKLFDPFFTAKPKGLGLGLTSARNIISSHSGEIQVVSEPGKGTTFSVLFKLAD